MQTYFSYANTAERGITGSNRLMRHNFNLRATTGLFRDRIARRQHQPSCVRS